MKRFLFVCVENSCRSQMAEAFTRILADGKVEAYSAGSRPSGIVNPKAVQAMKEIGYDLTTHQSRSLEDLPRIIWDYVALMGCGDECPNIPARVRDTWNLQDPADLEPEEFAKVRDKIEEYVREALDEFNP